MVNFLCLMSKQRKYFLYLEIRSLKGWIFLLAFELSG